MSGPESDGPLSPSSTLSNSSLADQPFTPRVPLPSSLPNWPNNFVQNFTSPTPPSWYLAHPHNSPDPYPATDDALLKLSAVLDAGYGGRGTTADPLSSPIKPSSSGGRDEAEYLLRKPEGEARNRAIKAMMKSKGLYPLETDAKKANGMFPGLGHGLTALKSSLSPTENRVKPSRGNGAAH